MIMRYVNYKFQGFIVFTWFERIVFKKKMRQTFFLPMQFRKGILFYFYIRPFEKYMPNFEFPNPMQENACFCFLSPPTLFFSKLYLKRERMCCREAGALQGTGGEPFVWLSSWNDDKKEDSRWICRCFLSSWPVGLEWSV